MCIRDRYPSEDCDSFGCYTGMALNDGDKVRIYYSGIIDERKEPCVAYGEFKDGKITGRHLIIERDARISGRDFRDPCVFKRKDGFYMLIGAQNPKGKYSFI